MKHSFVLYVLCASLLIASCSRQEWDNPFSSSDALLSDHEVIVLQERDPQYPLTDYTQLLQQSAQTRGSEAVGLESLIGRSYKLDSYPYESTNNIGIPVIDMAQYAADYPDYYFSIPSKESMTNYHAFSGFQRFEATTHTEEIINANFSFNMSILSIGAQNEYKRIFDCSTVDLHNYVFGELGVKFNDRRYELIAPQNVIDTIAKSYLKKSFLDQLHYTTPREFIQRYGGFVLSKFFSGGQATALFRGIHIASTTTSSTQKENNLNIEMKGSVQLEDKSNSSPAASLTIGRKSTDKVSTTRQFSSIAFSVRTLGGIPAFSQFTMPKELNEVVFDLSAWSQSLTTAENLTISELPEDALIPISEFIEEDNLKDIFYTYYQYGIDALPLDFEEPHIEIYYIPTENDENSRTYYPYLVTRYGEFYRMNRWVCSSDAELQKEIADFQRWSSLGHLRMELRSTVLREIIQPPYMLGDECEFLETKFTKFIDTQTGKIYLLRTTYENKKLAFSIYGEYAINDYGMEKLIEKTPLADNMDLETIKKEYRIIAL